MPPHGGVFVGLWLLLAPSLAEPPSGSGGATLAFVFDITGSMYDDLVQVMDGASRILERTLSRSMKPISNYVLVPFHDPEVGPATLTADPRLFQRRLRELHVQVKRPQPRGAEPGWLCAWPLVASLFLCSGGS
uniref:Hemicentin-1-like von Willebrand factor A domain-containing protein n=1 Tax=Athene cunicularia TaxID=194338 RepID=A0A663N0Z1_ATHCN